MYLLDASASREEAGPILDADMECSAKISGLLTDDAKCFNAA